MRHRIFEGDLWYGSLGATERRVHDGNAMNTPEHSVSRQPGLHAEPSPARIDD